MGKNNTTKSTGIVPVNTSTPRTKVTVTSSAKKHDNSHFSQKKSLTKFERKCNNATFMFIDIKYVVNAFGKRKYDVGKVVNRERGMEKKWVNSKHEEQEVLVEYVRVCAFSFAHLDAFLDKHNVSFKKDENHTFIHRPVHDMVGKDKDFQQEMFVDWKTDVSYRKDDRGRMGAEMARTIAAMVAQKA